MFGTINPIAHIRDELKDHPDLKSFSVWHNNGTATFWSRIKSASQLILEEKEIMLFSALQWLVIAIAYLAWTQILGVIPDDVWQAASDEIGHSDRNSTWLPSIILLVWSIIIVGIAALPLGILNASMIAAHMLRRSGQESTIYTCLALSIPNIRALWHFQWLDGWITVNQIFDRLPSKNDRRTAIEKAASEALYYAWKIGTAGMLSAIMTGRGLIKSGKSSLNFTRHSFSEIAKLRAGYSLLCWIIGIGTYIGGIILLVAFPDLVPDFAPKGVNIERFYVVAVIPLMLGLLPILLFLRPLYAIAISDLYLDYFEETDQQLYLERARPNPENTVIAVALLATMLLIAFIFRHELGIMNWLSYIEPSPWRAPTTNTVPLIETPI